MKGEQEQIKKATAKIGEQIKKSEMDKIHETLQKATRKGMAPKDVMGLTDAMIEGIYGQAYRLYNTGKYKEAAQIFRLLIMINAIEPKYTMGLAASFHLLKEFKKAVEAYAIVGILDPKSPISFYHASDCYVRMADIPSATIALEMAIKRAGEKPEYKTLKDRAHLTLEALKKEIKKNK